MIEHHTFKDDDGYYQQSSSGKGREFVSPTVIFKDGSGIRKVTSNVPAEEPLLVEINGARAAVLMRLPGAEKELAVGFCVSEGLINGMEGISLVQHCGGEGIHGGSLLSESRNVVKVSACCNGGAIIGKHDYLIIRSGCGRVDVDHSEHHFPVCDSEIIVGAQALLDSCKYFSKGVHKRTAGGLHTCILLSDKGSPVVSYRDVGRHNAMDKAIGYCLIRDIELRDKVLVTTGRISYEMVLKAARVNLPMLVSLSAATSLAVELGKRCNLTLVGYLKAASFVAYSGFNRIIW